MDEVTRGFPFFFFGIISLIVPVPFADSFRIERRQSGILMTSLTLTMLVLGIDEASAYSGLHIDKVKLYDTCDQTPVFLTERRTGTLLSGQLQKDTRGQGQLVIAVTIVAHTVVFMQYLPFFECLCRTIRLETRILLSICIGSANGIIKVHIAGQSTKVIHIAVDAKIVAVHLINACLVRFLHFVQRNLTHTVDGIELAVFLVRHTVTRALHHHTTTEDTTEVGTLDGIHDTACIGGNHTFF